MNNVSSQDLRPSATLQNGINHKIDDGSAGLAAEAQNQLPNGTKDTIATIENHVENGDGDGRADSEAETVVMPGKEELKSSAPKKVIKHEGSHGPDIRADPLKNGSSRSGKDRSSKDVSSSTRHSSKAKDPPSQIIEHASSSLSTNSNSHISSPAHDHEYRPPSRAASDSAQSKSKFSHDSDSHSRASLGRKRKVSADESEDKLQRRRVKREKLTGSRGTLDTPRLNKPRSESPARQRPRALSTQSSNPQGSQKRKKPPPLLVGTKRKASAESDSSDESSSPRLSAHPRRLTHTADSDMSRRRRDKNGRTPVAKACANNDLEGLEEHLRDFPEELNEADNAGNTPLQVASLEGNAEIVRALIGKGCKLDCKNCDNDTPLIDSVENGHLDVVRLLLKAGVNPRQVNAQGEEPIDLVDLDGEDGERIKAEIQRYRARYDSRRRSEDTKAPSTGKESLSAKSPRESPSLTSARSPPPPTSRRRGRVEPTRNEFLYLNPTRENLRDKAGKGDYGAVMHILGMRSHGDIEAVLAAAKGGHDECLSLILAMCDPKPDPDPDPLDGYREGYNTPMLAAIGRNNSRVIQLILEQPNFNPTRRLYKNLTYPEIAKQRGSDSEEVKLLQTSYDKYKERHPGKTTAGKSNKSPQSRESKKIKRDARSDSPTRSSHHSSSPNSVSRDALTRKRSGEGKDSQQRLNREKSTLDKSAENNKKLLKVPKRSSREGSNTTSDREASPLARVNGGKVSRSLSDPEVLEQAAPKPRKRLVSRKDLNNDQKHQRRNSLISMGSSSSNQDQIRADSINDRLVTKLKRELPVEKKTENKKRIRRSASPEEIIADLPGHLDSKKTKRPRINSDSSVQGRSAGPARVANMSTNQPSSSGAAPVAFMGKSNTPQLKDTKTQLSTAKLPSKSSPSPKDELTSKRNSRSDIKTEPPPSDASVELLELKEVAQADTTDMEVKTKSVVVEDNRDSPRQKPSRPIEVAPISSPNKPSQVLEASTTLSGGQESPRSPQNTGREDNASRSEQKEEDEAASLEAIRQEQERARQFAEEQRLAEEARLKKIQEEEEAAAAAEVARQKRAREEEVEAARQKKKREDEEAAQRRKRQEEEQRRYEHKLKEEKRRRQERLPNGLRIAAELESKAQAPDEIKKWLPLKTADGAELDPDCTGQARSEKWVSNIQAAPILAEQDLDLSRYTAWLKRTATSYQRERLFCVLRSMLMRHEHNVHPLNFRYDQLLDIEKETRQKYDALKSVFWIRLSDLLDVVPRYPHLSGIELHSAPIAIHSARMQEPKDLDDKPELSVGDWGNFFQTPQQEQDQQPRLTNGDHSHNT